MHVFMYFLHLVPHDIIVKRVHCNAFRLPLSQWDISAPLAREPLILEGGYGRWYLTYSPLCLGKPRQKEKQPSDGDASRLVDKKEGRVSVFL